jgi:DNA-binding transcriptional regulator YdaS (Cro superfamily)
MDLKEYIFYENRKDKTFTQKKMAEMLGIAPSRLSQIVTGRIQISGSLAYKIEQLTEGKVSGWELIKNHIIKNQSSK